MSILLPVVEPFFIDKLTMMVMDYDKLRDDVAGSTRFGMAPIKSGVFSRPFWAHIYGAPPDSGLIGARADAAKEMNKYPELGKPHLNLATNYNGSILLSMFLMDDPNPVFKVLDMPTSSRYVEAAAKRFSVVVDLCTIFYFLGPSNSKRIAFNVDAVTVNDVPDIIISVRKDGKGCTYLRFKATEYLDPKSSQYEIELLRIDRSTETDLKNFQSGYLRFRIGVFSPGNSVSSDWKAPPSQPKLDPCLIIANLYAARNLPAGDDDGLSDPEAVVHHFGAQGVSKVIRRSVDPNWSQRILLNSYSVNGVLFPLVVTIFDRDESLAKTTHELLGTVLIPIEQCRTEESEVSKIPNPKWYVLNTVNKAQLARISMSVQVIPPPRTALTTLIQPLSTKKEVCKLKFFILGLRGLISGGLFDVKNPYIKMNVGSMKGSNAGYSDILTASASIGGPDANFNNLISIDVMLPSNMSLMPALTCKVYDVARSGIGENYIGSFTVDLAKHAIATKLFFIMRLTRLKRYLIEKKLRPDAIDPITKILEQMKQYLTSHDAIALEQNDDPKEVQRKQNEMQMQISKIQESQHDHQAAIEQMGLSSRGTQGMQNINVFQRNKDLQDRIKGITQSQQIDGGARLSTKIPTTESSKPKVVIMAAYETKDNGQPDYTREKGGPPAPWIALGHVSLKDKQKGKHYRLTLDGSLEGTNYLSSGFFDKSPVFRGKAISTEQSWLASMFFKEEPYKQVGLFRGEVKLIEERFLADVANLGLHRECQKLQLPGSIQDWDKNPMDKLLITERKVKVYIYVVDVDIYVEKDIESPPDPYLVLSIGHKEINDKQNRFLDTYKPNFYCNYE